MNWPKYISVDKRIVQVLSGSTYENFPKAARELVTNSYDADATEVSITLDEDKHSMVISDNGTGMSESDLDLYFRIAGRRREKTPLTRNGRQIVGQFGVGFLAVFPFCHEFRIESKRKGSAEAVYARIPTAKYFTPDNRLVDVSEIVIEGGAIAVDAACREESYTKVELKGFTRLTEAFLSGEYGPRRTRNSIRGQNGLKRLIWQLEEDLPLHYENKEIENLMEPTSGPPISVFVNGQELLRRSYGKSVLEKHKGQYQECGKIKFRFVVFTDFRSVLPIEARFLKIRNLNIGVGERTTFGVGAIGPRSRLHHLSGEIHILEGLNDLLAVNRDDFNYSADYEDMKEYFARKLRELSSQLEKIHDLSSLSLKSEGAPRVGDLRLLNPKNVRKMADSLKKSGFIVKAEIDKQTTTRSSIGVDKEKKTVTVPAALDQTYAKIRVQKEAYVLKLEMWDWRKQPLFPAIRFDGHTLIINSAYPLFQGRKYTDIFLKLHMLLLTEFEKGNLPQKSYQALVEKTLLFFEDYVKGEHDEAKKD